MAFATAEIVLHPGHVGLNSPTPEPAGGRRIYAGENLRRQKTSGVYYVQVKRLGKQFRLSFKPATRLWPAAD
jgi:hypothetical protein